MSVLATIAPRLAPLIRLLGSDNNGEVSAAVAGLRRILASKELDLHDLAAYVESAAEVAVPTDDQLENWLRLVDDLTARGSRVLDDRDRDFLFNVRVAILRGKAPSPSQQKWLGDIQAKVKVRARG